MPQGIDDFAIVLPELTDMAACELKVYDGFDWLWHMVERYKMTAPIAIRIVDNKGGCVRAICGLRYQAAGWQLEDETTAVAPPLGGEVEFSLTINVQDAKGNILKMRVQLRRGRSAKAQSHKADTHAPEESDHAILSMNQTNKEERSSAEPGEKRAWAKENIVPSHTSPDTARGTSVPRIERCASSSTARIPQGGSRMRESRWYGSVRGAISDGRPYRDTWVLLPSARSPVIQGGPAQ